MKFLGFLAVLVYSTFAFSNDKYPVVQDNTTQSYLDIEKPEETFDKMQNILDSLNFLKNESERTLQKLNKWSSRKTSDDDKLVWEEYLYLTEKIVLQSGDEHFHIQEIFKNVMKLQTEIQQAYIIAKQSHNRYYLKQTTQAHLEYLKTLKYTQQYLSDIQGSFNETLTSAKKALEAFEQNMGPKDIHLQIPLKEYALQLQALVSDFEFLHHNLEIAFKNHSQSAQNEQLHSFASIKAVGPKRLSELVEKSVSYIQQLVHIPKTALNESQNLNLEELIDLLEEAKKNQRPAYNQLMQVIDVEKHINSNPIIKKLEKSLKAQVDMVDGYLLALETNSRSGLIHSKQVEQKYHQSFYNQLKARADSVMGLKCNVLFY